MRESLKGVLSRVDRLAARQRFSPEDWDAKVRTMSNEELHAELVAFARKAGVSDAALAKAVHDPEQFSKLLNDLQEHCGRVRGR
jgi:hypothetical protein